MQIYDLFASPQLCIPKIDSSSLENPDKMFIFEDLSKTGTRGNDFYFNLMDAIAASWAEFTEISLIGAEVTFNPFTIYSNIDFIEYKLHKIMPDVWKYLKIQGILCEVEQRIGCFEGKTTIFVYLTEDIGELIGKIIVFQDLIITTKQFFDGNDFKYCPILRQTSNSSYETDKNIKITTMSPQISSKSVPNPPFSSKTLTLNPSQFS